MASPSFALNEYRIRPVFHVDSASIAYTEDQLDVTRTNGQNGGGVETRWKQEIQVGSGAFASVWRERNDITGELRAVKRISKADLRTCSIDPVNELGVMAAVKDVGFPHP